jgi:hypothetical protein
VDLKRGDEGACGRCDGAHTQSAESVIPALVIGDPPMEAAKNLARDDRECPGFSITPASCFESTPCSPLSIFTLYFANPAFSAHQRPGLRPQISGLLHALLVTVTLLSSQDAPRISIPCPILNHSFCDG